MTILGHDSTLPVTMDEMLMLTRAVVRGVRRAFVVADMPFGTYQTGEDEALRNAIRFVKDAGADAVKLEGAGRTLTRIGAILDAGIPVMGHVGLTPQSASLAGSYKARGRRPPTRDAFSTRPARSSARAVSRSCSRPSRRRSRPVSPKRSKIPTIGIGAGARAMDRCSSGTTSWGLRAGTSRVS